MGFDTMKGRQIAIRPSTTTSAFGDSECERRPHGAHTQLPSDTQFWLEPRFHSDEGRRCRYRDQ